MHILRGVGSQALPCGCLVGLYETYSGETITVVDACGSQCAELSHRLGTTIASHMRDARSSDGSANLQSKNS